MLTSNSMLMMQRSMDFLWQKQACILDNIANVETPGYKVKYATFEESLENAIRSTAKEKGSVHEMRQAIQDTTVTVHETQESTRMDENGVDVNEQSVELVRNGFQMQYVMEAISSDITLLRTAIQG